MRLPAHHGEAGLREPGVAAENDHAENACADRGQPETDGTLLARLHPSLIFDIEHDRIEDLVDCLAHGPRPRACSLLCFLVS